MTEKVVLLEAAVSECEKPAVRQAAQRIADALGRADEASWTCNIQFVSVEALDPDKTNPAVISLLPEAETLDEAWSAVETRLRAQFARVAGGGRPTFLCTVLRRPAREATEPAFARLMRIRQLNLLATELSRANNAYVIDIDRVGADIGALRLGADYRLQSDAAAEFAGKTIAAAIIAYGLDEFAEATVLESALAAVQAFTPKIAALDDNVVETVNTHIAQVGRGLRGQKVELIFESAVDGQAKQVLSMVLKGQMPLGDAVNKFVNSVRSRGAAASVALLLTAVRRGALGRSA